MSVQSEPSGVRKLRNDTPVCNAFDTVDYENWRGTGTREAIAKRGLRGDGIFGSCPHEELVGGWRDAPIPPRR
jgi:hypothetical protein